MPSYDRTAYLRGLDLESIPGVYIDTIRPDAAPTREVTSANLAFADGETVLRTRYTNKRITLQGHIELPDRWDYEMARDQILGMLDSELEIDMVFEQSGKMRKYVGVYENISFTYKERGFVLFTITFRATQPFGVNIDETIAVSGLVLDQPANTFSINIAGNVYSFPRIVLELTEWPDEGSLRKITIEAESEGRTTSLELPFTYSEGSVIVIDGDIVQATVNGIRQAYIGRFPVGRRNMNITVRDDASERLITAQVRYNERNM